MLQTRHWETARGRTVRASEPPTRLRSSHRDDVRPRHRSGASANCASQSAWHSASGPQRPIGERALKAMLFRSHPQLEQRLSTALLITPNRRRAAGGAKRPCIREQRGAKRNAPCCHGCVRAARARIQKTGRAGPAACERRTAQACKDPTRRLDGEALAALGTPCVDHRPPSARVHAHQKAMGAGAADFGSLISAFHVKAWESPPACAGSSGPKEQPAITAKRRASVNLGPIR